MARKNSWFQLAVLVGAITGALLIYDLVPIVYWYLIGANAIASASISRPFVNSLGMKFVPAGTDGVLFCIWDVRFEDYLEFNKTGDIWMEPNYHTTPVTGYPAANVSWDNAQDFCAWLTKRERARGKLGADQEYRLPTDAEWSRASGLEEAVDGLPRDKSGKIQGVYPWGSQWPPPTGAGNFDGEDFDPQNGIKGYRDGYQYMSPVGSFVPNKYGLYDMGGNVWQWCQDKYDNASDSRVLRGAAWNSNDPLSVLSSYRNPGSPHAIYDCVGFRVVLQRSPQTGG